MSAEDNPKDDNYNLDIAIDEIKLLQSQLENSLSLDEIKRRLNLVNWYAYGFSSEDAVCMRDEVHEALGIK